jgi:hypothetical protein
MKLRVAKKIVKYGWRYDMGRISRAALRLQVATGESWSAYVQAVRDYRDGRVMF